MFQFELAMPEDASARIESYLAQTCPVHIGTTLDGAACPMCDLTHRTQPHAVAEEDAIYLRLAELEAEDGTRTETYIRLEERAWELED